MRAEFGFDRRVKAIARDVQTVAEFGRIRQRRGFQNVQADGIDAARGGENARDVSHRERRDAARRVAIAHGALAQGFSRHGLQNGLLRRVAPPFVAVKEKQPIFDNGAAQAAAEDVANQFGTRILFIARASLSAQDDGIAGEIASVGVVEPVVRRRDRVAMEFIERTMKLVRARFDDERNLCARRAPLMRAKMSFVCSASGIVTRLCEIEVRASSPTTNY